MANNPIESAIFLILSFVSAAGILFIFHVDFLGLLLIIIYVGAIAVLFLFVIMMLNIKNERKDELNMNTKIFLSVVSLTIISSYLFLSINVFNSEELFLSRQLNLLWLIDNMTNIDLMGQVLFNYYLVAFLLAGLVLLIALIGAIVLTVRFNNAETSQLVYRQLSKVDNNLSFFKTKINTKNKI